MQKVSTTTTSHLLTDMDLNPQRPLIFIPESDTKALEKSRSADTPVPRVSYSLTLC